MHRKIGHIVENYTLGYGGVLATAIFAVLLREGWKRYPFETSGTKDKADSLTATVAD